jgi:hypothetical protein
MVRTKRMIRAHRRACFLVIASDSRCGIIVRASSRKRAISNWKKRADQKFQTETLPIGRKLATSGQPDHRRTHGEQRGKDVEQH